MCHSFSRIVLAAGILLSLTYRAYAGPPTDIQMLPPVDFSNNTCAGGNAGILYSDGVTTIKCIPGSLGDASGDVTAAGTVTAGNLSTGGQVTSNSLLLSGATGVLNDIDANVLISLAAQSCGSNEALSISGGVATCVSILNLAQIGPATFPDCGTAAAITWNGANFSCAAIPAPTPPASASCTSGFMTGISGGNTPICAAAALASTSCTAGMYVTGVDSTGNPVCSTPPAPPAAAKCGGTFPNSGDPAPGSSSGVLGYDSWESGFCPDNPAELENDVYICQSNGSWGFITATDSCD
jgi:hypothetical protein